jgi:outer membrane cobalamin receptor
VPVAAGVPFELRVRRPGFADAVVPIPGSARDVTRDVTMQVGRVSDTLLVTESRTAEGRVSVTESVTVITRDDIEGLGAGSLADVLRFVPGLSVEAIGREGAVTSVFARGGESDYNLVLIDGVRVNASGGGYDFGRISAGEIDRVEVVRGAQSSLWGSDAMGSVIQIFTGRPAAGDTPRLSGTVETGTQNSWRGDVHVSGRTQGRVDYQAGVTHRSTDGAFQDILADEDWFEHTGVDASIGARVRPGMSIRTGVRAARAQARSVGSVSFGERNTGGSYDTTDLSWHTELTHTAGSRFAGTARFNYFRADSVNEDTFADPPYSLYAVLAGTPGALYPNGTRLVRLVTEDEFEALVAQGASPAPGQFLASATGFNFPFTTRGCGDDPRDPQPCNQFRRSALRYQGDALWGSGQHFSAGVEWEREHNAIIDGSELDNSSLFLQHQVAIPGGLFVTAGLRVDSREGYDTFVSPRLSAGGFIVRPRAAALSSVKAFGSIGRGIKAPSFDERFGSLFSDPSPELKVERARTADMGAEATFARERVRATVTRFDNAYRDQVAFRFGPVGDGIPEYVNIDGSDADGWELEAALQRAVAGVTVAGTYSHVETRVVTALSTSQQFQPGQPLLRRPRHSGTIRGAYTAGRITARGDVLFVGDRHDNSFLSLQTVPNTTMPSTLFTGLTVNPGYVVAGLGLDVRLDRTFTAFVRVNNVGDTDYDAVIGYPGMPRTAMVGVRFGMGGAR